MHHRVVFVGATALLLSGVALARPSPPAESPAMLQSLFSCRAITDPGQRLACFDKVSGEFAAAVGSRELVVIDKVRASEAKKSLFGFSVPNFAGLFGGGDDVNQIEGTVSAAYESGYDGWTIKLTDGSTWMQTDGAPIALPPRSGDKVVVKRGALGSYILRIGSQPGLKVKRVG